MEEGHLKERSVRRCGRSLVSKRFASIRTRDYVITSLNYSASLVPNFLSSSNLRLRKYHSLLTLFRPLTPFRPSSKCTQALQGRQHRPGSHSVGWLAQSLLWSNLRWGDSSVLLDKKLRDREHALGVRSPRATYLKPVSGHQP